MGRTRRNATYVNVDDHFTEHTKVLDIGPVAEALWLRGLLYCSRNLTDGLVPRAFVRRMGDVEPCTAEVLVRAGLWEDDEDGYRVHDYLDWQRSKAEAAEISQVRAVAGKKGGMQRAANQAKLANSKQIASEPPSKAQANRSNVLSKIQANRSKVLAEAETTPELPPPTPLRRYANGGWAAAVGPKGLANAAKRFYAVNVQLTESWLERTMHSYDAQCAELPTETVTTALAGVLTEMADVFERDDGGIRNPQGLASKRIGDALRLAAERQAQG